MMRVIPPTITDASARDVWNGLARRASDTDALREFLLAEYEAREVRLFESGTMALGAAVRIAAVARARCDGSRVRVAYPAYACPDIAAALIHAGVDARAYLIDPETLAPDTASLSAVLTEVAAVIVAPLYGLAYRLQEDVSAAQAAGVLVIEDAAQSAGSRYDGRRVGSFGDASILSFGRGKGFLGGGGGALLLRAPSLVAAAPPDLPSRHSSLNRMVTLASVQAQTILSRPRLYGIPRAMPWLNLGISAYHPLTQLEPLANVQAALAWMAFPRLDGEAAGRRETAEELRAALPAFAHIRTDPRCTPGYLRLPFRAPGPLRGASRFGIERAYTLTASEVIRAHAAPDAHSPAAPPSALLHTLHTAPTHRRVDAAALASITAYLADTLVSEES